MKNAEEFIRACMTDKELAEKANSALSRCKTEAEATESVIEFAKTLGYGFDAEEFTEAAARIREMPDRDLDNVAGGVGFTGGETNLFLDFTDIFRYPRGGDPVIQLPEQKKPELR